MHELQELIAPKGSVVPLLVKVIAQHLKEDKLAGGYVVEPSFFVNPDKVSGADEKCLTDIHEKQRVLLNDIYERDPFPPTETERAALLELDTKLQRIFEKYKEPCKAVRMLDVNEEGDDEGIENPQLIYSGSLSSILSATPFCKEVKGVESYSDYYVYEHEGQVYRFIVWDAYGDEDLSRHNPYASVCTLCLTYFDEKMRVSGFEACDLIMEEVGALKVINWKHSELKGNKAFSDAFFTELGGKRAFYYYPEDSVISLRCYPGFYVKYPEYQDPERPVGNPNLSGTRVLFKVSNNIQDQSFKF